MKPVADYFIGVKKELAQTTWPKGTAVAKLTLIVLLSSAIVGIYVGVSDFGFTKLLSLLLR